MPQVPVYRPQVDERGLPSVRISDNAPIEAFGGGQSAQGVANAVGNLGKEVSTLAQLEKDRIDQEQASAADTKQAASQTQIQIAVSKKLGRDANGSAEYAKKAWEDSIKANEVGLTGNGLLAYRKAAANRSEGLNDFVEKHTSSENVKAADNEDTSRITTLNGRATLNANNPALLNKDLLDLHNTVERIALRKGIPQDSETYAKLLNGTLSQTHKDVIGAMINSGNISGAEVYFHANKDRMTADDLLSAKSKVDDANVVITGNQIVADGLTKRLPGGGIDQVAMFKAIDAMERIDPAHKVKIANFVKARVSEENVRTHQVQIDKDTAFKDWAANQKSAGKDLSSTVATIPDSMVSGPADKLAKQQWLGKIFNPSASIHYPEVTALSEKLRKGGGSLQEVDDTATRLSLNEVQHAQLRNEYLTTQTKAVNVDRNITLTQVKSEIRKFFPKGRENDEAEVIAQVERESVGKTGAQTRAIYDAKMKNIVITPHWYGDEKKPQWKIDKENNSKKINQGPTANQEAESNARETLKAAKKDYSPQSISLFLYRYPTGKIK